MRIYEDSLMTKEVSVFDFGIVPAGETKQFRYWVVNDSNAHLRDLKFSIDHEEVEILEAPEELMHKAVGELVLEWSPSITLKEGLRAQIKISGIELWG